MSAQQKPRMLLLGHGRLYIDNNHDFRCAPMPLQEMHAMLDACDVTMVDDEHDIGPDIVFDLRKPWYLSGILALPPFDVVVEAVSRLATNIRGRPGSWRRSYWQGVHDALKPDGVYYGNVERRYNHDGSNYMGERLTRDEVRQRLGDRPGTLSYHEASSTCVDT